jgi:hypothetical protein
VVEARLVRVAAGAVVLTIPVVSMVFTVVVMVTIMVIYVTTVAAGVLSSGSRSVVGLCARPGS